MRTSWKKILLYLVVAVPGCLGLELNLDDPASIRSAAATIVYGLQSYYTYNRTGEPWQTGTFQFPPYYWWESGAVWGGMIDYWAYTGDTSYVAVTGQALLAQAGPNNDYMMPQFYSSTANDDQAFWGLSVMSAAEYDFPRPTSSSPSWLSLAQNLFDTQAARWDATGCGGGLRWQIFPGREGYDYKNSVSNGAFFQLAARLARFTRNQTYVDWADRTWEWCQTVALIGPQYQVYDGTDTYCNAKEVTEWSYNNGLFLYGAAIMSDYTGSSSTWHDRVTGLVNSAATTFFSPFANATNIMYEPRCEFATTCNTDQQSFKGYLARWMAKTAIVAPYSAGSISPLLHASAMGAAASCSGGANGVTCGTKWYVGGWDGREGLGQQLSALEVLQALLAGEPGAPLTQTEVSDKPPPVVATSLVIPLRITASTSLIIPLVSSFAQPPVNWYTTQPATPAGVPDRTAPGTAPVIPQASESSRGPQVADSSAVAGSFVSQTTRPTGESGIPDSTTAFTSLILSQTTQPVRGPDIPDSTVAGTIRIASQTIQPAAGSGTPDNGAAGTSLIVSQTSQPAGGSGSPDSTATGASLIISQTAPVASNPVAPGSTTLITTAGRQSNQPGGQTATRTTVVVSAGSPAGTSGGAAGTTQTRGGAAGTSPTSRTGTSTGANTGTGAGAGTGTAAGTSPTLASAGASIGGLRLQRAELVAAMVCFGSIAISTLLA